MLDPIPLDTDGSPVTGAGTNGDQKDQKKYWGNHTAVWPLGFCLPWYPNCCTSPRQRTLQGVAIRSCFGGMGVQAQVNWHLTRWYSWCSRKILLSRIRADRCYNCHRMWLWTQHVVRMSIVRYQGMQHEAGGGGVRSTCSNMHTYPAYLHTLAPPQLVRTTVKAENDGNNTSCCSDKGLGDAHREKTEAAKQCIIEARQPRHQNYALRTVISIPEIPSPGKNLHGQPEK